MKNQQDLYTYISKFTVTHPFIERDIERFQNKLKKDYNPLRSRYIPLAEFCDSIEFIFHDGSGGKIEVTRKDSFSPNQLQLLKKSIEEYLFEIALHFPYKEFASTDDGEHPRIYYKIAPFKEDEASISNRYNFKNVREITKTHHLPAVILPGMFEDCETTLELIDHAGIIDVAPRTLQNCESLKEICIPNVVNIGISAFSRNPSLHTVYAPYVRSIDRHAFSECSNLKHVDISHVEYIGNFAFSGCKSLKHLDLYNRVKIDDLAFCDCYNDITIALHYESSICSLSPNIGDIGTTIHYYVPDSLYEEYVLKYNKFAYKNNGIDFSRISSLR